MSISPTEGVGASYVGAAGAAGATPTAASVSGTAATDQMNKDMFLRLMVAQLKNQDPMNPTDSSEFLAQTAQFTSLEKLAAVAEQSAQALAAQMAFGASGLVGRTVTYTGPNGAEVTGTVGSVRFTPTGPVLGIGPAEVALGSVVAVSS